MKANNAIVIMWRGETASNHLVERIAGLLIANNLCVPEDITIVYKDADSIANALIGSTIKQNETPVNTAEAVKHAVIYIGERFKASLAYARIHQSNVASFALELNAAVEKAIATGCDEELLSAVQILSTTNAIIPQDLAKKHRFTQAVVEVIKKVYNRN